ncbi:TPA: hypothetical protein HA351_08120 [Methanosarcinaceae archaeon]|nr:hypothetical protein [Methanosarcinaceae archaeon]
MLKTVLKLCTSSEILKKGNKKQAKKRPEEGKKTPKMSEKEPEGRMKTKK